MAKLTPTHIAIASLLLSLASAASASGAAPYAPPPPYFSLSDSPAKDAVQSARHGAASLTPAPDADLAGWFSLAGAGAERDLPGGAEPELSADADATDAGVPLVEDQQAGRDWRWRRVKGAEYATVSVAALATAYFEHENGKPTKAEWTSRNGFDELIRDALRLKSRSARNATDLAGHVLMGVMIAAPVLDSLATLGIRDANWDALWQTEMINLESFTFTSLISSLTQNLLARERPFVRDCQGAVCESNLENRGMPSGHVAFAFTGAGLICNHHKYQSLYNDPATDRAACATGIGLATLDGLLRIVADRHYATDVAAGTVLGLFSGFVLPRLLHYSHPAAKAPDRKKNDAALIKQMTVSPMISGDSTGLKCEFRF